LGRITGSARLIAVAALAFGVVGCGGSSATAVPTPSPTPLTDPNEIITQSAESLATVHTLHVEMAISGSFKLNGLGGLAGGLIFGSAVKLDGTTVSGDVELPRQAYHMTLSVPVLFGVSAEVIGVDGWQYTKSTLTGGSFSRSAVASLPIPVPSAGASMDLSGAVNDLRNTLLEPGVKATLRGRDEVEGRPTYRLSVVVPKDLMNAQLAALGGTAAAAYSVETSTIEYWVYVDTLTPAKAVVEVASPSIGNVHVSAILSRYDQPVTIAAPSGR
jgi:hypothetical protein